MKFIPSLLEYSVEQLEKKVSLIKQNLTTFETIQNSKDIISLHLDFVESNFAKDRKVMTSTKLETVLKVLDQHFYDQKLELSIHLMSTIEDLYRANDFLKNHDFNPNWQYCFYVPKNYTTTFNYHSQIYPNVKIGIWFDKNNWDQQIIEQSVSDSNSFLLMTVVAGKSGQKLDQTEIDKVQNICKSFPDLHFLADGGWSVDSKLDLVNLEIISYTSFWKTFEEKLKLV